jgi:ElaB/YqjD/DUF883 family membrane-anchored ribosome-binding protein
MDTEDIKARAKAKAQELGESTAHATQKAKGYLAEEAHALRETAQLRADQQLDQVTDRVDSVSQALKHAGRDLRERDEKQLSSYMDKIGDYTSQFSSYLHTHDTEQLINDTRGFARRNPAVFMGSALAVGFIAGRLLQGDGRETRASRANAGYGPNAGYGSNSGYGQRAPLPPSSAHVGSMTGDGQPGTAKGV